MKEFPTEEIEELKGSWCVYSGESPQLFIDYVIKYLNNTSGPKHNGRLKGVYYGRTTWGVADWHSNKENNFSREISLQDFVKIIDNYKKNKMKKDNKKIIGYKAPYDLFNGKVKQGAIYDKTTYPGLCKSDGVYCCDEKDEHNLPKEIVENWEPVYEEVNKSEEITIGKEGKRQRLKIYKNGKIEILTDKSKVIDITDVKRIHDTLSNIPGIQGYAVCGTQAVIGCCIVSIDEISNIIKIHKKLNV